MPTRQYFNSFSSSPILTCSRPLLPKVANHELTGLMAYFNLGFRDVCTPLMSLVDYRGFRLVAMSVLPVSKDTLIYG